LKQYVQYIHEVAEGDEKVETASKSVPFGYGLDGSTENGGSKLWVTDAEKDDGLDT